MTALDIRHKGTVPYQVMREALIAQWSERAGRSLVLACETVDQAREIIAAGKHLAGDVCGLVLRDRRHTTHEARVAAMREAAAIMVVICELKDSTPYRLRDIRNWFQRTEAGLQLMCLSEVRGRIAEEVAQFEEHAARVASVYAKRNASISQQ